MNRLLILSAALLLLAACTEKQQTTPPVRTVHVARALQGNGSSTLCFSGVVEEGENISLGFKTPGQLSRIFVKEGDRVRRGQLLAELDADDYRLGVEALQIQYDQLKEEVARARRLFEKKSMSANDYEKAEAGLRQLQVQLQVNKNKLAYTRLYAPASGIIESVNFSAAEMVDAGTAVFSMIDDSGLEVVCDIPATAYVERSRFESFSCSTTHDYLSPIPLKLISIVPKADGNQLYRMHLAIDKADAAGLTAGLNVEVRIALEHGDMSDVSVPASAVFKADGRSCVWVLGADSTLELRDVTTDGHIHGDMVGISSGLKPDEQVVRAGVSSLQQGEKVRVVEKASETNVGGLL